jgi:hypothetical protein
MHMDSNTRVHASFRDPRKATSAVEALIDAEFTVGDLRVVSSEGDQIEVEHQTGVTRGAIIGGVAGAVVGSFVTSYGLMLAGPLEFMAQGAVAGLALGMLAGTLGGLAFWKKTVRLDEAAFARGPVRIEVNVPEARAATARAVLEQSGGEGLRETTPDARPEPGLRRQPSEI